MSRTLALLLLLLAIPAGAQESALPEGGPGDEETPAEAADDNRSSPEPAPDANGDPFDYQSSEQISEDLSVSFPVDI